MCVEDDLTVAVYRASAGIEQLIDVGLLDLVAAQFDLDVGDVADQPARTITCPHVVDGHAGHPLGKLDRFADREFACGHVGDVAALDPAALPLTGAQHGQAAVVIGGDDQRTDLGRADVERGDQLLFGRLSHRAD